MKCRQLMVDLGVVVLVLVPLPGEEAQQIPLEGRPFEEQVLRSRGQGIVPLFDGWYQNADGTFDLCFGYYSLNTREALDIPIGPDNSIRPAEFEGSQPTHFDPVPQTPYRRYYCVFTVVVPADFATKAVVWTLRGNGARASTPGHLHSDYVLDEPHSDARGESAPTLSFEEAGARFSGRHGYVTDPKTVAVGEPLNIAVWVEHSGKRSWLGFAKHQGPGKVSFSNSEAWVERAEGPVTVAVRFDKAGSYVLRVQAIENPVEDFEFHCCWTNGYIQVNVSD